MYDYQIYHGLMSGHAARWMCMGSSMEPVYSDGEAITIYPFTADRPHPAIGDVVHFYTGRGFDRHQVADIFTGRDDVLWYRLAYGNGMHDQFVERGSIIGYVIPDKMAREGTEPRDIYGIDVAI